jgi:hypothetical protein
MIKAEWFFLSVNVFTDSFKYKVKTAFLLFSDQKPDGTVIKLANCGIRSSWLVRRPLYQYQLFTNY